MNSKELLLVKNIQPLTEVGQIKFKYIESDDSKGVKLLSGDKVVVN